MNLTLTQRNIINVLLMQGVWLACVLGGTRAGWLATLLFFAIYLRMFGATFKEGLCIVAIAAIGFTVDSTISLMELMIYPEKNMLAFIPLPGWMVALWLVFATLFLHGLQWLRPRPLFAAAIGAIAGTATYYAGSRLGNVKLGMISTSFVMCYGALWAIMTPLFGSIAATADEKK